MKTKVEIDELSSDLKSFEARIEITDFGDFFLNVARQEHYKGNYIGDIIIEFAAIEAEKIPDSELFTQYRSVNAQIGGTPEEEMRYAAEQDIINEVYKDFQGMSGVQNIVGYIAFNKAYEIAEKNNGEITLSQYEKIHNYIEEKGDDDGLCIAKIEDFVEKTCQKQIRKQQ